MSKNQLASALPRLFVFHVVAESGSQSEAARLLGLTQPTVSEHLRNLRKLLGDRLFESKTGLTRRGAALHRHTSAMFRGADALDAWLFGRAEEVPGLACRCGAALADDPTLPREEDVLRKSGAGFQLRARTYTCRACGGGAPRLEVEIESAEAAA